MAILIENRQTSIKLDWRHIKSHLNKVLTHLDCRDKEISLSFVDNETIRELNRIYLGRDEYTNVISFSLTEGEFGQVNPHILGDIVVSVDRAKEDALKTGLNFEDMVDFLLIHGLLHLLGYDHERGSKEDELKMRQKERDLFHFACGITLE